MIHGWHTGGLLWNVEGLEGGEALSGMDEKNLKIR